MAFRTHVKVPQAAGSLPAAAVRSQPSLETADSAALKTVDSFQGSKGGYQYM